MCRVCSPFKDAKNSEEALTEAIRTSEATVIQGTGRNVDISVVMRANDQCALEADFCGKIRINATITTSNASEAVSKRRDRSCSRVFRDGGRLFDKSDAQPNPNEVSRSRARAMTNDAYSAVLRICSRLVQTSQTGNKFPTLPRCCRPLARGQESALQPTVSASQESAPPGGTSAIAASMSQSNGSSRPSSRALSFARVAIFSMSLM
jgi:hypothetical protein